MEQYERIRKDREAGAGIRELSRRYGVHRRTVHEALESAVPRTRKAPVRESPVLSHPGFRAVLIPWPLGAAGRRLRHGPTEEVFR